MGPNLNLSANLGPNVSPNPIQTEMKALCATAMLLKTKEQQQKQTTELFIPEFTFKFH